MFPFFFFTTVVLTYLILAPCSTGRLKGSIDQVDRLIWFEGNREEDDAQGKAGGLGEVEDAEDTGATYTKKWDNQIRLTAANVRFSPLVFLEFF